VALSRRLLMRAVFWGFLGPTPNLSVCRVLLRRTPLWTVTTEIPGEFNQKILVASGSEFYISLFTQVNESLSQAISRSFSEFMTFFLR